ncbi:MAG: hypothetical protein ABSA05_04525 [Opitutaceae bacterium]|jgi:hypothetical protein
METVLGFIHWHWRSGWSTAGIFLLVAILVVIMLLLSNRGDKGKTP